MPIVKENLLQLCLRILQGILHYLLKIPLNTSELLTTQRDTLKPIVEKHGGSWMKEIGDGLLTYF